MAEPKEIIYNKEVASGYFRMGISWATPVISPGQFVMVRASEGLDPLLRRPLGIYKVLGGKGRGAFKGNGIELLYRVVGRGTRMLSEKEKGERVSLLGPLGNGFPPPDGGEKVIMAAGGMGIVPLYLLAKSIGKTIGGGVLLFGARSATEARIAADFKGLKCRVRISTEDGSVGKKGLVTALIEQELTPESVVYACCPAGMLRRVSAMARHSGARCFVSLERPMACGIGVCLGCAVKTMAHGGGGDRLYKMVCSDGPVFNSEAIDWEKF